MVADGVSEFLAALEAQFNSGEHEDFAALCALPFVVIRDHGSEVFSSRDDIVAGRRRIAAALAEVGLGEVEYKAADVHASGGSLAVVRTRTVHRARGGRRADPGYQTLIIRVGPGRARLLAIVNPVSEQFLDDSDRGA